jgi:hypothetical protein
VAHPTPISQPIERALTALTVTCLLIERRLHAD